MTKKYKLGKKHPTENLFRIIALRDFLDVKSGDIGGWIESDKNLSHEGLCWVFGDARVYGDARVFGNAQVSDNARVYGDARVFGDAWVFGNARVFGDARVFGNAWVCKSKHTTKVKYFSPSKHSITIDGEYLNIGCMSLTVKEWLKDGEEISRKNEYTDEQIEEYRKIIKCIANTYFNTTN